MKLNVSVVKMFVSNKIGETSLREKVWLKYSENSKFGIGYTLTLPRILD